MLTCPPDFAYGAAGAGSVIPPNATLTFEVQVIDFRVEPPSNFSLGRCLRGTFILASILLLLAIYLAYFFYQIVDEGELVLDRAPGFVTIAREADTMILHVKGDDWKSIAYGQGFASA